MNGFDEYHTLLMIMGGRDWYREMKNMEIKRKDLPDWLNKKFEPIRDKLFVEMI